MRSLWTKDKNKIIDTANLLIEKNIPVSLRQRNAPSRRTRIFQIREHEGKKHLILHRPNGMDNCQDVAAILTKYDGAPILSIPCKVAYKTETLFAARLPDAIYQIDLRENPRFHLPGGSIGTFFVKNKTRVSMCGLVDISKGGAKLSGYPETHLGKDVLVGPTTLSVTEEGGQQIIAEITIKDSVVAWYHSLNEKGKCEFGLKFMLSDFEKEKIIHFLESCAQDLVSEY